MANIKKIKLGDVTYDLRDADAARISDLEITSDSTTTVAVGGISKGTSLKGQSVVDVIESIFFPYVPFAFSSISTSASAGAKEYGTPVTISKVTPSFTAGSEAINSVKIGTTDGGDDLYSGTTASTGAAITLTNSKTYDGTTGGTIYCTLSDGTTTLTKNVSISYIYHNYIAVTADTTIPTTGTNNGTSAEATITTTDNSYIWFLMPNQNKKTIQQFAMNQWNNMATTYAGTVDFTTSTGKQLTYYAYRSDKMMSAPKEKYRIN